MGVIEREEAEVEKLGLMMAGIRPEAVPIQEKEGGGGLEDPIVPNQNCN